MALEDILDGGTIHANIVASCHMWNSATNFQKMPTDLGGSSIIQEAMLMDLRKLPVMFFLGEGGSMRDTRDTQDVIYKIFMDVAYYIYIFLGILWILDIIYDVCNWILWNLDPKLFCCGIFYL